MITKLAARLQNFIPFKTLCTSSIYNYSKDKGKG